MDRINTQKLHENDTLDVPHDIIENILVQLPVKSLLRFKVVSKTWEATISDPIFAQFHLQQSLISGRRYIFIEENLAGQHDHEKFKLGKMKNKEFQVVTQLDYPSNCGNTYFMCYLDGLLLLRCYAVYNIWYTLWNPSTGASIRFECPHSLRYSPMLIGFCYDPWIEDYKVVIGHATHYTVFNCKDKCWTTMKELPIIGKIFRSQPAVCFNGSLYWVLYKYPLNDPYSYYETVRFDPKDDKLEKVNMPEGIPNFNGSFCLLGSHLCLYYNSVAQLFIMKKDTDQDSWMEFITIDMVPSRSYHMRMPLFMSDENEIILFNDYYYFAYDMKERSYAKLNNLKGFISSIVFPFVESLMLGNGCNISFRRQRAFEELREVFFLM